MAAYAVILVGQTEVVRKTANSTVTRRSSHRIVFLSNLGISSFLMLSTAEDISFEIRQPGMLDHARFDKLRVQGPA